MADKPAPKSETKSDKRQLAPAAESSDPAVHQLLAEIQTAVLNEDASAEADARKRLADLGYE